MLNLRCYYNMFLVVVERETTLDDVDDVDDDDDDDDEGSTGILPSVCE